MQSEFSELDKARMKRDTIVDSIEDTRVTVEGLKIKLRELTNETNGLSVTVRELAGMPEDIRRLKSYEYFVSLTREKLQRARVERDNVVELMDLYSIELKKYNEQMELVTGKIQNLNGGSEDELRNT